MKIEKNVRIEFKLRTRSKYKEIHESVEDMLHEGGQNVCVRCESRKEAKGLAVAMIGMKKKRGWPVKVALSMNDVYIIYEGNKK